MAELLFAFLKNRGFGKKWVSNFTKSSSIFSGFFRILLLSCEDEKSGGRRLTPTGKETRTAQQGSARG